MGDELHEQDRETASKITGCKKKEKKRAKKEKSQNKKSPKNEGRK